MLEPLLGTLRFLREHPLTADHPVQTMARYLRWQVGSRLLRGPVAMSFVNNARLLVEPGMHGATGNVYTGLHEFNDMAFLLHVLRPEDLFVDVGANVGSYTILAAKVVGARVLGFEPIPITFARLTDNIRLNGVADRVDARQACVGRTASVVRMTSGLDCMNHVVSADDASGESTISVPQVSIDQALDGKAPFLMKLDVEGYELEALAGASATLSDPRLHTLILEVNQAGAPGDVQVELSALLTSHGFERAVYEPFERSLRPPSSLEHCGNAVFVRGRELVLDRLTHAPSFRVLNRSI